MGLRGVLLGAGRVLDGLCDVACRWYLSSSLLSVVRDYCARVRVDVDYFALLCALYDFAMPVPRLIEIFKGLVAFLEGRGLSILDLSDASSVRVWHRFDPKGRVLQLLLEVLSRLNLEEAARSLYGEGGVEGVIRGLLSEIHTAFNGLKASKDDVLLFRKFVPSPRSDSCLKRVCLFLRWVCRREYPDLGLWRFIKPSELFIPLDKGVARVLGRLAGTKIRLNWSSVVELTDMLRELDPDDPVKYDFPLSRIAILGLCKEKLKESDCPVCPLRDHCRSKVIKPPTAEEEQENGEHDLLKRMFSIMNPWGAECFREHAMNGVADIICFKPSMSNPAEVYVVEVKVNADVNAVRQVLHYKALCKEKYPELKLGGATIVAKEVKDEAKELSAYNGITIWLWKEEEQKFTKNEF